jgi:hypothetical protein
MKGKIAELLRSALIGGMLCSVIAVLLKYFIFPFPKSIMDNVIGHGMGNFFSGFFASIVGVPIHIKFHNDNGKRKSKLS